MQKLSLQWRSIIMLNVISTFAQLGQFGIGFAVLPIWLAARHVSPVNLGFFGAVEWAGMLQGLLFTLKLVDKMGSKQVILLSLISSSVGLLLIPFSKWPIWLISAFLIGFGMGLRWIAVETWLYRVVPKNIVGQVAGFHEALIALAMIIPPALVAILSTSGHLLLIVGVIFNLLAAIPLLLMQNEATNNQLKSDKSKASFLLNLSFFKVENIALLGLYIAIVGGVIDGALMALFSVFGLGRGLLEAQIGALLATIGIGGLFMQYPIGWLSDRAGFIKAGLLAASVACLVATIIALTSLNFSWLMCLCFLLGAMTTCFLTLGIIAAAYTQNHDLMAQNMSKVSIAFTASSILGALSAGFVAENVSSDAVIWLVAITSGVLTLIFIHALYQQKSSTYKVVS